LTKVLGDKLAAAMAAEESERRRKTAYMREYRSRPGVRERINEYNRQRWPETIARAVQNWADKGAGAPMTPGEARAIRDRHVSIYGEYQARGGWIPVTALWECPSATRHARLCNCDAWTNGQPVSPDRLAL